MLKEMAEKGERVAQGGDRKSNSRHNSLKIPDIGITHNQSSNWQQIAEIPEDEFEKAVAEFVSQICYNIRG